MALAATRRTSSRTRWIASDKLVFNNQLTYVGGGFFLDYQDCDDCGTSSYLGAANAADYTTGARADPNCLCNTQSLLNRTTSVASRSLTATYQTTRPTWEVKTDGTYFLTQQARRRPQPEVRPRLAQGADR